MSVCRKAAGLLLLGLWLLAVGQARAERVPSTKTVILPNPGARGDLTVPYTTNGRTTLGVYNGVGPYIYGSPVLPDPANPQGRPVFNLPFYGGGQAFGTLSNGAVPRPPNNLRGR
jgi:hypothetical protein